jgi:hypothetical protein
VQGAGCRVQGAGSRVLGVGYTRPECPTGPGQQKSARRIRGVRSPLSQGSGFMVWVEGFKFVVYVSGFMVSSSWYRVYGLKFVVHGSGFMV